MSKSSPATGDIVHFQCANGTFLGAAGVAGVYTGDNCVTHAHNDERRYPHIPWDQVDYAAVVGHVGLGRWT